MKRGALTPLYPPPPGSDVDRGPSSNTRALTHHRVAGGAVEDLRPPPMQKRRRRMVIEDGTETARELTEVLTARSYDDLSTENDDSDMMNFSFGDNGMDGPADPEQESDADSDAQQESDAEASELEETRAADSHESIISRGTDTEGARRPPEEQAAFRRKKQDRAALVHEEREREREEREREEKERQAVREREIAIRRQRQERAVLDDLLAVVPPQAGRDEVDGGNGLGGVGGEDAVHEEQMEVDMDGGGLEREPAAGGGGGGGRLEVLQPQDNGAGAGEEGMEENGMDLDETQVGDGEGSEDGEAGEEREEGELDETITEMERSIRGIDLNDDAVGAREAVNRDQGGARDAQGLPPALPILNGVGLHGDDGRVRGQRHARVAGAAAWPRVVPKFDPFTEDRLRPITRALDAPIDDIYLHRGEVRRTLRHLHQGYTGFEDPPFDIVENRVESWVVHLAETNRPDVAALSQKPLPAGIAGKNVVYDTAGYPHATLRMETTGLASRAVSKKYEISGRQAVCNYPTAADDINVDRLRKKFSLVTVCSYTQEFTDKLLTCLGAQEIVWDGEGVEAEVHFFDTVTCRKVGGYLHGAVIGGVQYQIKLA